MNKPLAHWLVEMFDYTYHNSQLVNSGYHKAQIAAAVDDA